MVMIVVVVLGSSPWPSLNGLAKRTQLYQPTVAIPAASGSPHAAAAPRIRRGPAGRAVQST